MNGESNLKTQIIRDHIFGLTAHHTGWTIYPPLSSSFILLSPSSIISLIFTLLISGISSSLTSINFSITILNIRIQSLSIYNLSLYIISIFITSYILLLTSV